jgi:hypothetical protein
MVTSADPEIIVYILTVIIIKRTVFVYDDVSSIMH